MPCCRGLCTLTIYTHRGRITIQGLNARTRSTSCAAAPSMPRSARLSLLSITRCPRTSLLGPETSLTTQTGGSRSGLTVNSKVSPTRRRTAATVAPSVSFGTSSNQGGTISTSCTPVLLCVPRLGPHWLRSSMTVLNAPVTRGRSRSSGLLGPLGSLCSPGRVPYSATAARRSASSKFCCTLHGEASSRRRGLKLSQRPASTQGAVYIVPRTGRLTTRERTILENTTVRWPEQTRHLVYASTTAT